MDEFFPAPSPSNTEFNNANTALQDSVAIIATGNTHPAIYSGQYVFVKGHGTLADGLYVASSNIAQNATLSTSNLIADANGGLNALNGKIINGTLDILWSGTNGTSYSAQTNHAITDYKFLFAMYVGGIAFMPVSLLTAGTQPGFRVIGQVNSDTYNCYFAYVDSTHFTVTSSQGSTIYLYGVK